MSLTEQVETAARDWFASEKGKTATKMVIAVAAGEVIGYLSNTPVGVALVVVTFGYVVVWVANKYTNSKKPPGVITTVGGGNQ